MDNIPPPQYNMCFYSSLLFLINVGVAIYYEYYLYSICFLLLTVTSLYYHSHYSSFSRAIDKIAIYVVICYGGYLFYEKIKKESLTRMQIFLNVIIVSAFISTILLYYYGVYYREDPLTADCYHSLMHCVSSVGHVCIAVV